VQLDILLSPLHQNHLQWRTCEKSSFLNYEFWGWALEISVPDELGSVVHACSLSIEVAEVGRSLILKFNPGLGDTVKLRFSQKQNKQQQTNSKRPLHTLKLETHFIRVSL
jgi:hypothetical protein